MKRTRKPAPCKHENAEHMIPGDVWALMDGTSKPDPLCEQFRCMDCGDWLSLGPSNDTHVGGVPAAGMLAIEVRAVDAAVAYEHDGDVTLDSDENAGWDAYGINGDREHDETAPYLVGWFAGFIYDHINNLEPSGYRVGRALVKPGTCSICEGPIDENEECRCGPALAPTEPTTGDLAHPEPAAVDNAEGHRQLLEREPRSTAADIAEVESDECATILRKRADEVEDIDHPNAKIAAEMLRAVADEAPPADSILPGPFADDDDPFLFDMSKEQIDPTFMRGHEQGNDDPGEAENFGGPLGHPDDQAAVQVERRTFDSLVNSDGSPRSSAIDYQPPGYEVPVAIDEIGGAS